MGVAVQFWNAVAANMPDWHSASDEKILPANYRREFVFVYSLAKNK